MQTDQLEKHIEKRFTEAAIKRGWLSRKFVSPGNRSVPDRIFLRNGEMFFVEFKRGGCEPTGAQHHEHAKIRAAGFAVFVVDDVWRGLGLLDKLDAHGARGC